ncbi:MAG: tRNA pseudouridine(55) synthase TruB [Bacteroides sp.]|nr:tRNA pseudouridine(55) synthase TruB [Roseburia sp.]MCM1346750.1 tRNA pseudouridine(55) synthase TruB [Bacteroides sp.]MCM1421313.1 tRNA pseudouridine(55) synthase TruB [Bacteroides sp.]
MNPQKGEIFCFNKPYTWTSFDVVSYVRNILKRKVKEVNPAIKNLKVGHAGTLDPLATGVLLVCTGKATKRIDELQAHTKEYIATLKFGATTPSFDKETEEDAVFPTEHITREKLEEVLKGFVGAIEQVPPAYSAVKVNGKRAYELARKGEEPALKSKTLVIDEIEIVGYESPENVQIRVVCSKGTYIRALARDIGQAIGSGAYLTALVRTRIGEYKVEDSLDVKEFADYMAGQTIDLLEE